MRERERRERGKWQSETDTRFNTLGQLPRTLKPNLDIIRNRLKTALLFASSGLPPVAL